MATEYYGTLCDRFEKLKLAFFPKEFSPTGEYDDCVFEHTRAYKAMTHAELESYFEETGKAIAKKAWEEWKENQTASRVLIALVVFQSKTESIPESVGKNSSKDERNLNMRVQDAYTSYIKYINGANNGIKEKNLLHIFLPLGLEPSDFPEELLTTCDSYGSERGEIVHKTRTKQILQPAEVNQSAENILKQVEKLDALLEKYL